MVVLGERAVSYERGTHVTPKPNAQGALDLSETAVIIFIFFFLITLEPIVE